MKTIKKTFSVGFILVSTGLLSHGQTANPGGVRAGFTGNSLPANDDGSSTTAVPLGFNINFFGNQRSSAWINNNGNITFDRPLPSFTPSTIALPTAEIIAPFFADVDTRGANSELVTYGNERLFGRQAFGVNWVNVGYFSTHDDKLNSFQLILIDRSDLTPGDFDIEFNYDKIEWESGDANQGSVNGLGGETARVGYSNGNGTDFEELPGSSTPGELLDGGKEELVSLTNVNEPGRYLTLVRNGEITSVIPITNVSAATLRDSVSAYSGFMTRDINKRLYRNRSGSEMNDFNIHGMGLEGRVEVFGSYESHSMTIDERVLSNAGGLLASVAPESELNVQSASAGIETRIGQSVSLGLAALFGEGDLKHKDLSFKGDMDSQGAAAYLSYYKSNPEMKPDFYFDLLVAKVKGDISLDRSILENYSLRSNGNTEFDSFETQLNVGAVFKSRNANHGPFAQLKMISGEIDSYTEQASAFGGAVSPKIDFDSSKLNIGYQYTRKSGNFIPQIRLSYEQELEDQNVTIKTLQLAAPPESAVVLGAGLAYDAGVGMFASIGYEYRYYEEGATSQSYGISFGLKF